MSTSSRYAQAWEGFWRDAPPGEGGVFWDSGPALNARLHLPLFEPYFDAGLPLLDVGCGNGTQTRFLAGRFPRAVGIDFSAAAVERARAEDVGQLAEFRRVDAADEGAMGALGEELGEVNVYLRGVLHQCESAERERITKNLAALLGVRGRLFAVEPGEAAKGVFASLAQRPEGPPAKLGAVFAHGIAPGVMADAEVPELLRVSGLVVLAQGQLPLSTTEWTHGGERIEIPTNWLVAGPVG